MKQLAAKQTPRVTLLSFDAYNNNENNNKEQPSAQNKLTPPQTTPTLHVTLMLGMEFVRGIQFIVLFCYSLKQQNKIKQASIQKSNINKLLVF